MISRPHVEKWLLDKGVKVQFVLVTVFRRSGVVGHAMAHRRCVIAWKSTSTVKLAHCLGNSLMFAVQTKKLLLLYKNVI